MNVKTEMRVKLRQINAKSGRVVAETPFRKNLVMDGGLNALAGSTNATVPAAFFAGCRVGSGSTADKISSGAVTFTQSGTTITADAPFFTAGMNGWLFKYGSGTGGAESYITFVNSTTATSSVSATVAVGEVAAVWNVTRTALETLLYSSATYETTAGACSTGVAANVVTFQRTFNFAQQVASYNVNEVGYFSSITGTTIFGRLVLPATEVVNPTNFLQVVLQFVVTYSPSAITAVGDVGTNIDTSGNAMLENLAAGSSGAIAAVLSTGATQNAGASGICIDRSNATSLCRGILSDYAQNASTSNALTTPAPTVLTFQITSWTYNSVRGQMRLSTNATISTSGQTLYGVMLGAGVPIFDVKFNSTYLLPTGSFLPQVTFLQTYDRNLSN